MKIKAKVKDCHLIVKIKLSFGEKLDKKKLDSFARIYIRGFLKPYSIKKTIIEYKGPVGISLKERLNKPVSKRDFYFLIEQIVVMSQKMNMSDLAIDNVILDSQSIFINENTKELQFLYLPMENKSLRADILEFMELITCSVIIADEEDRDYISRFAFFLKGLKQYDADLIEKYISKEDRSVVNTIKKQNVGQSGFMTNKHQHFYEHYEENANTEDDEATGLLEDEDDEETGLLMEESEDTVLLNENPFSVPPVHYPALVRVLTDEVIDINKPVFRIGKEKSYVDYSVMNNVAVSRSHADIVTRERRYFVIDLNSKNHTYINGQMIPAHNEVEIQDGDCLRLANEEFVFRI